MAAIASPPVCPEADVVCSEVDLQQVRLRLAALVARIERGTGDPRWRQRWRERLAGISELLDDPGADLARLTNAVTAIEQVLPTLQMAAAGPTADGWLTRTLSKLRLRLG